MAGRKPLPTNIKLLRGNPGKRPLNEREPEPKAKLPRAPEHLNDEAKREWRRMAHTLYDLGLLTEIDRAALAAYCVAWGRWVEAEKNLQKYGTVMMSPEKRLAGSVALSVDCQPGDGADAEVHGRIRYDTKLTFTR